MPIIPEKTQVTEIINACEQKYACIFTILTETAAEGMELHKTPISQIHKETGEISINGVKQHRNGVYKLKPRTTEMLQAYLSKYAYNEQYPFPPPKYMRQAWEKARNRAARNLCKPELEKIPLKNLRNYAGAQFYLTHGHDPIATMRFMRHRRLEQTLHYIQSINLDEPEEYHTIAIQLGQSDTQKKILEYSNAGYQKFMDTIIDGYIYMRIRKT